MLSLVRGVGIRPPAAEADSATLRNDKQKIRQGQEQIRRFWLRQNDDLVGLCQNDDLVGLRQNDDLVGLRQNDDLVRLRLGGRSDWGGRSGALHRGGFALHRRL
jgi:hypothetical protein